MEIDDKNSVYFKAKLQERNDGLKFFYLPRDLDINGMDLKGGDDVLLGIDKKTGVAFFPFISATVKQLKGDA